MEGQDVPLPQQPNPERSPFGNGDALRDFIIKERQPVDYSRLVTPTTRVLALGETHSREITKLEVIAQIEQLKGLGFTHFGMEMFGTDAQPALDDYQRTGDRKGELVDHIRKGFGGYSPHATELYLKAVDEAKRVGLRVVAIDLPKLEQDKYKGMEKVRKCDDNMKQTVKTILDENPQNKVFTLTGSSHINKDKSRQAMVGLLTTAGIETVAVDIVGGLKNDVGFGKSAIEAGVANERFMIASPAKFSDSALAPYDWLIHLPQVETETVIEAQMKLLSEINMRRLFSEITRPKSPRNPNTSFATLEQQLKSLTDKSGITPQESSSPNPNWRKKLSSGTSEPKSEEAK